MRILMTGASSFTGYWFVRALSALGHDLVAIFTGTAASYRGTDSRAQRYEHLKQLCECVHETRFGDRRFLGLLGSGAVFDRGIQRRHVTEHGVRIRTGRQRTCRGLRATQHDRCRIVERHRHSRVRRTRQPTGATALRHVGAQSMQRRRYPSPRRRSAIRLSRC